MIDDRLAVAEDQRNFVRHLLGLDHVAAAHLDAVELQLARDAVHQPLHDEHRLRPAGAAHRRGRHFIGERDRDVELVGRHHVGSGHGHRGDVRHHDAPRREGAGVVQHAAAERQQLAVLIDSDRNLPVLVALLDRAEEMFAAILEPLHRTADLHCRRRDHCLLGIERRLRPEAAADVGRDHADQFEIALEQIGKRAASKMWRLRRRPYRQHVGRRFVARQHRPRLHRHAAAAVRPDLFLEYVRRACKRCVDVAVCRRHNQGDVARNVGVHQRRARRHGFACVARRRQHLEIDRHHRGGVLGEMPAVRDHHGDSLAGVVHLIEREAMLRAHRAVVGHRQDHGNARGPHRAGQVGGGQHGVDAWHRQRR